MMDLGQQDMIYIENTSIDPYYNLALEEQLFDSWNGEEPLLMLWRNENAVIIGRFQNTYEQLHEDVIKADKVRVVRRITGGGAVYHDLGNLNYTFMVRVDRAKSIDFKDFALPVVQALRDLGAQAEFAGRNDILLDGCKISGTAQYCRKDKVLFHGTLLFDVNLDMVGRVLRVNADKLKSKGVQSVRKRVTNIRPFLDEQYGMEEFQRSILYCIRSEHSLDERPVSEDAHQGALSLVERKYGTWDWNYGKSPQANYRNHAKLDWGGVDIHLDLNDGVIASCKIYGDFLGLGDITPLERAMCGVPYDRIAVDKVLGMFDLGVLFGGARSEELLPLFFAD